MEFKGTKKNWRVNDTDNKIFGGTDNYTQITAGSGFYDFNGNIQSGFNLTGYISNENALLISKAPEMLEMLKSLYDDLKQRAMPSNSEIEEIKQLITEATTI